MLACIQIQTYEPAGVGTAGAAVVGGDDGPRGDSPNEKRGAGDTPKEKLDAVTPIEKGKRKE